MFMGDKRMSFAFWLVRLPLVCVVVLLAFVIDFYLVLLKKLRGSILFPETY